MRDPGSAIHPATAIQARVVTLRAPGRLHLGFLDPAGTLGRRFGSIGLVVDGFATALELRGAAADGITRSGPGDDAELERARRHLASLREHTGLQQPLHLHFGELLPAHAGFGSGTQLALAVGRAFAQWHGLALPTVTLARWLARGLRSGVGIAGFEQGGLLVDGGPSVDGSAAPLLARLAFPDAWRIVVVVDPQQRGLSGAEEKQAIATLAPLPQTHSADICHQLLMRVLPGAANGDFAAFAAGVSRIQQVLGEHFAPAQQGSAFSSAAVARLLGWVAANPRFPAGAGQSSWGPTGFAIVESQARADALVAAARAEQVVDAALQIRIVRGQNHGAAFHSTNPSA